MSQQTLQSPELRIRADALIDRAFDTRLRWPVGVALALLVATQLLWAIPLSRTWVAGIDLRVYLAAAHIGMTAGWSHIYDAGLQRPLIVGYFAHVHQYPKGYWTPFVTPPPAAWLVAPLSSLPISVVWILWAVAAFAAVAAAAVLLGRTRPAAALGLLLMLAVPNNLVGIEAGNLVCFLLLAFAAAVRLAQSGRHVSAGVVLSLFALKPQLGLLVAPALMVAGQWRLVATFAATMAALAVASLISLGGDGVRQWIQLVGTVGGFHTEQSLALPHLVHPAWLGAIVVALLAAAAVLAARFYRSTGPTIPLLAGVLGSLAVSPYLNGEDYMLMAAAGILLLQVDRTLMRMCGLVLAAAPILVTPGAMIGPAGAVGVSLIALAVLGRHHEAARRDLDLQPASAPLGV